MSLMEDLLHTIYEGEDFDDLPEDVMTEIQKNIRNGAKDRQQLWSNALELVHKAYEVTGVQRPTPDMKNAWKQYEENLQYAVEQLSKYRGIDGSWRMSSSVFHEALQKMTKFHVRWSEPNYTTSYETEARTVEEVISYIRKENNRENMYEIKELWNKDGSVTLRFLRFGVNTKCRIDITPVGVVGAIV